MRAEVASGSLSFQAPATTNSSPRPKAQTVPSQNFQAGKAKPPGKPEEPESACAILSSMLPIVALLGVAFAVPAAAQTADLLIENAVIRTANKQQPAAR